MSALRHNRIYCVFVGVGTLQLALLEAIGESQITLKGLIPMFLLVLWLGYGSRVAWGLFLIMNTFALAAALGILLSSPSGGTIWGNVVVLIVGSSALIITLLSPSMREYVGSRRSLADSHTLQ